MTSPKTLRRLAWGSTVIALVLLFWPNHPGVSLLDLPGVFGGGSPDLPAISGPWSPIDAFLSGRPIDGAPLVRMYVGLGFAVAAVALGIVTRIRARKRPRPASRDADDLRHQSQV